MISFCQDTRRRPPPLSNSLEIIATNMRSSQRSVVPHPQGEQGSRGRTRCAPGGRLGACFSLSSHLLPDHLEVELQHLEQRRIAEWLRDFGSAGYISDLDADGHQTPAEIFDSAKNRLDSLVSLGVMAGLLAGTAISTLDFSDTTPLGDAAYALAFISSACSLSVAMLVSYHYFNGTKLMVTNISY